MLLSGPSDDPTDHSAELAREQAYVTTLYAKLDAERVAAQRRLDETLRQTGGTPQARTERDVATTLYTDRLAQLGSVEQGLAFGRLDFVPENAEETTYIGRLGLFDEDDDYKPLLVDWRAPRARPLYPPPPAAPPRGGRRPPPP